MRTWLGWTEGRLGFRPSQEKIEMATKMKSTNTAIQLRFLFLDDGFMR